MNQTRSETRAAKDCGTQGRTAGPLIWGPCHPSRLLRRYAFG